MVTRSDLKHKYCDRVAYYSGKNVAGFVNRKLRPVDERGQDVWDRTAIVISEAKVNLDDYLDWCFKEAVPGLPYLNTLSGSVDKFISAGKPITTRKEVSFHVQLLLDRFKALLIPQEGLPNTFPKDILFDPRHEFHPVFAVEMAKKLDIGIPEKFAVAAKSINETLPYYFNEMETLLKDWTY